MPSRTLYNMDNGHIQNASILSSGVTTMQPHVDGNYNTFHVPSHGMYYDPRFANTNGASNSPGVFTPPTPAPTPPTHVSTSLTSSNSDDPSTEAFVLKDELEKSVNGSNVDLYAAGASIQKAYECGYETIQEDLQEFSLKYCRKATNMLNPPTLVSDVSSSMALMHGYGLMSRFAHSLALKQGQNGCYDDNEFCKLPGAAFHVKKDYFYPTEPPFSGKKIDISKLPEIQGKAHIRLKHYLFSILSVACSDQKNIQRAWLLPGEKLHNYLHLTPFPEALYDDLKELFLVYFELDAPQLEVSQFQPEFEHLPILQHVKDLAAKKRVFKLRSQARAVYTKQTFRKQLKEALRELKSAVFVQRDPTKLGEFQFRKRGKANDAPTTSSKKARKSNGRNVTAKSLQQTVENEVEEEETFHEEYDDSS